MVLFDPAVAGADDAPLNDAEKARRERKREAASGVVEYSLTADATTLAFSLGGELWVLDGVGGDATRVDVPHSVYDPQISPDGTAIGYVANQSLYCVFAEGDSWASNRPLVVGAGEGTVSWGAAEFIAAEEMQRARGFWWTSDSAALLATRVDEAPVDQWWIADPAHPTQPARPVRYPGAGTNNATVDLAVIPVSPAQAEAPRFVDWSNNGEFEYLANIVVAADHDPILVRQTRDQRTADLAFLNIETARCESQQQVTDETWVELIPGSPTPCPLGLLTVEDRQDTRHLCLNGVALTPKGWQVRSIVGLVAEGDHPEAVLVTAWVDPRTVAAMLVRFDDPTHPVAVAPDGPRIQAAVTDGTTIVVTGPGAEPGITTLVYRPQLASSPTSAVGSIADHSTHPGFSSAPLFLTLGHRQLNAALFVPSGHNGVDRLPVLLDPYGGPHAQRVLDSHNSHLPSRWFAEQGFAVLVIDGRGTPGKGPRWEREVWGDLATPVLEDQIDGLDAAARQFPFLDTERVGIRGWSFGGYLAALAVLARPDRFHAAVAGAPVTSWHLYDTHYTERYLGHPHTFPQHYKISDLIDRVVAFPAPESVVRRPVMLIHGLADDNVVAAHTLQLSTALLAKGYPHEVLPLSGVTHMTPQLDVAENLLKMQLAFLSRALHR